MPKLGEKKSGKDIGINNWSMFVWHACPDCGRESWVREVRGKLVSFRCKSCAATGGKAHNWKGGRIKLHDGYVGIWLNPNDFFYSMVSKVGYVKEHRLVMAQSLGRCLHSWEIVHHRNHKRDDNRIENLQLVTDDRHKQLSILENKISNLERRLTLLEAENVILRQQMGVK